MDWVVQIGESCLTTLAWLVPLGAAFALFGWLTPCNPGMYWWRDPRGAATDLLYRFVMPVLVGTSRILLLWAGVTLLFGGGPIGFASLGRWAIGAQCVAVLLFQDVMMYWIHRAFHTRPAWKFHAVHHSPRVLDWIAAARFHLVNSFFSFALTDVLILLLGFSPAALAALVPFSVIYSAMVHANLNWTFGPLRFVFASPVFHRWHHVADVSARNKNFASTFPVLDVLFGTFYMPSGELPAAFGIDDEEFPEDFWGQLVYPFRKKRPETLPAAAEPLRKVA
jgi:sterol desaturase/sphingolipid hydroxylase (fatty acid hydroxylase superfamily)